MNVDITDFPHLKDEVLLDIAQGNVYPCCPDPTPVWLAREVISLRKKVTELQQTAAAYRTIARMNP